MNYITTTTAAAAAIATVDKVRQVTIAAGS